jgi:2,3-bisphosphoglycerate-independent phosphoglycerate mutase
MLKETTNKWHEIAVVDVERGKQIKEKARQVTELVEEARRETENIEQERRRAEEWKRVLVLKWIGKKTRNHYKEQGYIC